MECINASYLTETIADPYLLFKCSANEKSSFNNLKISNSLKDIPVEESKINNNKLTNQPNSAVNMNIDTRNNSPNQQQNLQIQKNTNVSMHYPVKKPPYQNITMNSNKSYPNKQPYKLHQQNKLNAIHTPQPNYSSHNAMYKQQNQPQNNIKKLKADDIPGFT